LELWIRVSGSHAAHCTSHPANVLYTESCPTWFSVQVSGCTATMQNFQNRSKLYKFELSAGDALRSGLQFDSGNLSLDLGVVSTTSY